jgi:broad specificity phosphatase PhoE
MPSGESYNEIWDRFNTFISELMPVNEDLAENYLIVSHGGLYQAVLPVLVKNIDFSTIRKHGYTYTGLSIGDVRSDGIYCLSWCGIEFDD